MPLLPLFYAQCQIFWLWKSYGFLNPVDAFVIEHVAAQRNFATRANGVKPIWKVIGDGCNPERETWVALKCWF